MAKLTNEEILRYSRHLVMPEVTIDGQRKLKAARVLCIGAGGLGSPLSLYLAAAGVGTLGLADFDAVDLTNLQRQVLYGTADVGRPKLEAAIERLTGMNPDITIVPHPMQITATNIMDVVAQYDIVVDGTDNFATRFLVNDACVLAGKANVYGSIYRFEGQLSVFDARRGPCYRCLFPEPPPPGLVPSCADGGVLGVLPGIVGSLQASEALKLILGIGEPLIGRLMLFDALKFSFRELALQKDPGCPVCGAEPVIRSPSDLGQACGPATTEDTEPVPEISAADFQATGRHEAQLIDVRDPHEFQIAHIDGARLIPLGELPDRLHELDRAQAYVLTCHHGPRALQAFQLMRKAGFSQLAILTGGTDAWARQIDPSMARY